MLRQALRKLFGIVPNLDLHGLGVRDAIAASDLFLREMQALGEPEVRLVYGKGRRSPGGRGVLRDVIPHWLENEGATYVDHYERQPDATGVDGAARVWLRVDSKTPLP